MAQITEIREIRGLVQLSLDGVAWIKLRKKHFAKRPLAEGERVEPEEYLGAIASIQAADCYEAALCMLDMAAQTKNDLVRKLILKGYAAPAAEAAAQRLTENGLIDDRRFAERVAQSQLKKPVGAYAVKRKLMAKRLSEEDIEAAMEDFDEEQQAGACLAAAEKLWRKYEALPSREGRAKLSQALARRGFSWDAVHSAVEKTAGDGSYMDD